MGANVEPWSSTIDIPTASRRSRSAAEIESEQSATCGVRLSPRPRLVGIITRYAKNGRFVRSWVCQIVSEPYPCKHADKRFAVRSPARRSKTTVFDSIQFAAARPVHREGAYGIRTAGIVRMMLGYARVSTDEQNADLQIDALTKSGCERILLDKGVSGNRQHRPALDEAIGLLQKGDTLVTWKLDRLGRSLSHLIDTVSTLEHRGIAFRSLSEAIDTRSATGRLLFHVMGALAEFE